MRISLFLLFFFLNPFVFSQENSRGFRGWEWGTDIEAVSDQLERSELKIPGSRAYTRKGDCTTFEGIETNAVLYLFKKEKFAGVLIHFQSNDFERITEILSNEYGLAKSISSGKVTKYFWINSGIGVEMLRIPVNERVGQITLKIFPMEEVR